MQPRSYVQSTAAADAIQDVYEKIHKDRIQPNNDSDAAHSHELINHELRDPREITILKSKSMRSRL
jgi:hypothetical protein